MAEARFTPGRIVWHELNTQEPDRSAAFYSELFGWSFDFSNPHYTRIRAGNATVGGMFKLPPPEVPTHWEPYISVADVDASTGVGTAAGCKAITGAMDTPNGRFNVLQDPQGALFYIWRSKSGDPPERTQTEPGHFCWDQLSSPNATGSAEVYKALFGWERQAGFGTVASSELSTFLLDGQQVAGLVQVPSSLSAQWLCFVAVESLASTRERTRGLGGSVFAEAVPVSDMGTFCVLQDSLGAFFAAFEPARR